MSESYAQAARRLLRGMDERKRQQETGGYESLTGNEKIVHLPVTPQGRLRLRDEMKRGRKLAERDFDIEAEILSISGDNRHGYA